MSNKGAPLGPAGLEILRIRRRSSHEGTAPLSVLAKAGFVVVFSPHNVPKCLIGICSRSAYRRNPAAPRALRVFAVAGAAGAIRLDRRSGKMDQ
jgi:hypothetical protein